MTDRTTETAITAAIAAIRPNSHGELASCRKRTELAQYDRVTAVGAQMRWLKVTSTSVSLTTSGRRQAEKFAATFAKREG